MKKRNIEQKIVAFGGDDSELAKISKELENGWQLVSFVKNINSYVGMLELNPDNATSDSFFIPPRKKLKLVAK